MNTRLNNDTWEEIIRHADDGTFEETYGREGYKDIILTYPSGAKEIIRAEIADLRHDDLADGSGKAAVTFIFKDMLAARRPMNSGIKSYNGQTGWNEGGWYASDIREEVNTRILDAMPPELRDAIVAVTKTSDTGYSGGGLINTEDKLFMLSPEELNMADQIAGFGYLEGQGFAYPIFTDNNSRKRWRAGDPHPLGDWYFTRSSRLGSANGFWMVYHSGEGISYDAYYSSGVVLGFCIGH